MDILCHDSTGKPIRAGDKIRGEGFLYFQDRFKIDRTPVVTVRVDENGNIFFGGLSKSSFDRFYKVNE